MHIEPRSRAFVEQDDRLVPHEWMQDIKDESRIVDDIDSIEVKLKSAPSWEDLRKFIPDIVMSTWANRSDEYDFTDEQKDCLIYRAMSGKFLPQAMECINLVFSFDGITSHDLTHILRTRTNTPIVECTGDSLKNVNDVSMSAAWRELGLDREYMEVVRKQEDLYAKAINYGMAIQDAREILPRMMHQFAIIRIPFNNVKSMAMQRLDMQIQPTADWVYAAQMVLETCRVYKPFAVIAEKYFDAPNRYYINESATNFASKFFKPLEQNKNEVTSSMKTYLDADPIEAPGHKHAADVYYTIAGAVKAIAEVAREEYPWIWSEKNMDLYR